MDTALHVSNRFLGLHAHLGDPSLSDISIQLCDGTPIHAHRLVLVSASDVLRAKFASSLKDSAEPVWSPDAGSVAAWQWLLGWMYGHQKPLPTRLLVEVLLLADQYQITELIAGIREHSLSDVAENVVHQILQAWACPDVLAVLAQQLVPLVNPASPPWMKPLWAASPHTAAVFIRYTPLPCEVDRIRLAAEYVRQHEVHEPSTLDGRNSTITDFFLNAIRWESLPAALLEAMHGGDMAPFAQLAGLQLQVSDAVRTSMHGATARRCRDLEALLRQGPPDASVRGGRGQGYLLPLGSDCLEAQGHALSTTGLFARMTQMQYPVEVQLSTVCPDNLRSTTALFALDTATFGTGDQSATKTPRIEVKHTACVIRPTAIGLKHGWTSDHKCQDFVVEAARGPGHWQTLVVKSGHPLQPEGELFKVPEEVSCGAFFDRFRVRMTGPNSSAAWCLMIAWFDVFGQFQLNLSELVGEEAPQADGPQVDALG